MQRLVDGFVKFQKEVFPTQRALFQSLKSKQKPVALFITCSDSRLVPNLLTQTDPGDLFLCRNAGNIVPPYGDTQGGVSATIEYAVKALKVPNIIICGHSDCGAMHGVLYPEKLREMPVVSHWLHFADTARQVVNATHPDANEEEKLKFLTFENVHAQLDNLKTHPCVATALAKDEVRLFAWVYQFESGEVFGFDAKTGEFQRMSQDNVPEATPPRRKPLQLEAAAWSR
jgi:carbonic anhydrase